MPNKQFPTGLAEEHAFLNRVKEVARLKDNIANIDHTVLVAPRRYGKTSLMNKVAKELGQHYGWIELLSSTSFTDVQDKVIRAVSSVMMDLYPEVKKLQTILTKFFHAMKPDIVLGAFGQKITLHPTESPEQSITDILMKLDEVAQQAQETVILVFDEFQQLAEITNGQALEASIRHAVERSKNVVYLFSGSNRHMLNEMFGSSSRPLYRLCELLIVERMHVDAYEPFLIKQAKEQWQNTISDEAISAIMELTERHPYYVNALCGTLWRGEDTPPTAERVHEVWGHYVFGHKSILLGDYSGLSLNQKKLLTALARQPTKEPYGKDYLAFCELSTSSVSQVIATLLKKDLILQDDDGVYRVLDPGISYYLRMF